MSGLHIDHDRCTRCGICVPRCPFNALELSGGSLRVTDACVLCGACVRVCPEDALRIPEKKRGVSEKRREGKREQPEGGGAGRAKGVWVLAEIAAAYGGNGIHPVSFELIGKGRELADELGTALTCVVVGNDVRWASRELCHYPIDRIVELSHPALGLFCDDAWAKPIAEAIRDSEPEILLAGATTLGRALIPRVAALVKTGLTADCTGLEIDPDEKHLVQTRPAFGGNIMATIVCPDHRPQIATVRPHVFPEAGRGDYREIEIVRQKPAGALRSAVEIVEILADQSPDDNIADAEIVVAGGRGLGSAEGFRLVHELADALNGAVGASRAAVDSGWIPYAHQVGQTGRTIQPRLYIACGISGAVQHLVGMRSAECIVAINRDPDAPIFDVADYGFVGDVQAIVRALTSAIRKRRTGQTTAGGGKAENERGRTGGSLRGRTDGREGGTRAGSERGRRAGNERV